MNRSLRVTAAAGLIAVSGLALTPLLAQDGPQGGPPMRRMIGPRGAGVGPGPFGLLGELGRELRALDVSDAQREQIRSAVQARQPEFDAIGERLRAAQQGLDALVTADTVDEAAIRAKSAELAAIQADAAVLRARLHQEVFNLLTAEQQAKARELRAQMQDRLRERAQNRRDRRSGRPRQP
jgi:protein CpxP